MLLAASPRWARRVVLYLTTDDDFLWMELVNREVHFAAVGQSVPVVVANLGACNEDLAEDQLST